MEYEKRAVRHKRKMSASQIWMIVGVVFLIILLMVWLTVAFFTGDTDVAACIAPML